MWSFRVVSLLLSWMVGFQRISNLSRSFSSFSLEKSLSTRSSLSRPTKLPSRGRTLPTRETLPTTQSKTPGCKYEKRTVQNWITGFYLLQLIKFFLKQMSGASDLNNRFKMISINNRTTSPKWLPLNKGYFFLSRRQSIHYEALATTTMTAATSLLNVNLIKLCRAYSNLLKMPKGLENFPGVEFLGPRPSLQGEGKIRPRELRLL